MSNAAEDLTQKPDNHSASYAQTVRSFIAGAIAAFLIQLLRVGIASLTTWFLARTLGATELGRYEIATTVVVLAASLAGVGFPNAIRRFLPRYVVLQEWGLAKGAVLGFWKVVLVASSSLSLCALVGLVIINDSRATALWYVVVLSIPLVALLWYQRSVGEALRAVFLGQLPFYVLWPLGVLCGSWYLTFICDTIRAETVMKVSLSAVAVTVCVQGIGLWIRLPSEVRNAIPRFSWSLWYGSALPLVLLVSSYLLMKYTDLVMLGWLSGAREAGVYSVALRCTEWILFPLIVGNAIGPSIYAALFAENRFAEAQRILFKEAIFMWWPAAVAAFILFVFGRQILTLFGPDFQGAYIPLVLLGLAELVNVGCGPVGWLLQVSGHEHYCARVIALTAALNIVLNALLIPLYGGIGAAFASCVSLVFWNIYLLRAVKRRLGLDSSVLGAWMRSS